MIDEFRGEYRFLSNFYPAEIEYEGVPYRTTEHAFAAAKTLSSEDRLTIAAAETPGQAKRFGRTVKLREDWELVKVSVMADILALKFAEGSKYAEWLLETGDEPLIEGNTWHDNYWGNCFCGTKLECKPLGRNELGKLLMYRREMLRGSF